MFYFPFEKKKLCIVNLHDLPVPRGTLVPSQGMARCVSHKHSRQKSSSDLARWPVLNGTTVLPVPKKFIQQFGTGGPCRTAQLCRLRRLFLRLISFFFPSFSCFFLTSSLSTKAKTLTSPPCYPPSLLKSPPIFFNFHSQLV